MALTKDAHKNALKTVQALWLHAIENSNDTMTYKWGVERSRILRVLNEWDNKNNKAGDVK